MRSIQSTKIEIHNIGLSIEVSVNAMHSGRLDSNLNVFSNKLHTCKYPSC